MSWARYLGEMTFGYCIACTKITLVIFTVDVNISRRYPQDILFYLGDTTNTNLKELNDFIGKNWQV
jgi:hypothetical protein